ncbi:MAG: phytanoyl-CoA dioxygenase family protein [Dongiaceae bacterium]
MPALSPEQVARYRAEGWLLLERALPVPALAALQAAAASLVALAATRSASDAVLDLGPDHRPGRPRVRRIKNAHLQHPAFAAICRDPRLIGPVQDLIGRDLRLLGAKVNIKAAGHGDAVEWHQDWAFYPHTNEDVLAAGIFLDEVGPDNAPLLVAPGSHRGPLIDHHHGGVFVGGFDPRAAGIAPERATALTGPAGSISLHHVRLAHGSAVNRSPRDRRILFVEIAAADAWPLLGVPDFAAWFEPTIIAGRPTLDWRMEAAPIRPPLPAAFAGALSADATIYDLQDRLPRRHFVAAGTEPEDRQ